MNTQVDKFVPQIYRESRDFQVFLKLIDILYSVFKNDINSWIKLYSALDCPSDFLPLLSDFVGYQYTTKLSVAESRVIINNFVQLLQNRGSLIGIKEAATILLNAQLAKDPTNEEYQYALTQLSLLEVYFDEDTGTISLYFPSEIYYDAEFFNYVRPLGAYLNIELSETPEPVSEITLENYITTDTYTAHVVNNQLNEVTNNDTVIDLNAVRVEYNISVGDTIINLDFSYSTYNIRPSIIGSSILVYYIHDNTEDVYAPSYNTATNKYEIELPIGTDNSEITATFEPSTQSQQNNALTFSSALTATKIYISYDANNTASRTSLSQLLQNERISNQTQE